MAIGSNLRLLRERRGLTQGELAGKIGVTAAAVGNYENNVSFPKGEVLYRLFDALKCKPNELFAGSFDESKEEELLRKYLALDGYGKELVNACADIEYRRCCGEPAEERTVLVAARGRGEPKPVVMKKRRGAGSIFDEPDYNGGKR